MIQTAFRGLQLSAVQTVLFLKQQPSQHQMQYDGLSRGRLQSPTSPFSRLKSRESRESRPLATGTFGLKRRASNRSSILGGSNRRSDSASTPAEVPNASWSPTAHGAPKRSTSGVAPARHLLDLRDLCLRTLELCTPQCSLRNEHVRILLLGQEGSGASLLRPASLQSTPLASRLPLGRSISRASRWDGTFDPLGWNVRSGALLWPTD